MTTSPAEFNKWINLLPGELREDLVLIPIVTEGKEPDVPFGGSWKDEKYRLSIAQAMDRLTNGKNVGVVANIGNMGFLDIEYPNIMAAKNHIPDKLIALVVKTRNGGLHLHYQNDDVENRDLISGKQKIIEARMVWRYVLTPGSFVPPDEGLPGDGLYKVANAVPPIHIQAKMLDWMNEKTILSDFEKGKEFINFEGKYMSLPCVKLLYEVRLQDGKKIHASKLLAIALDKDNIGANDSLMAARAFAAFQSHPPHPVTANCVMGWVRSVGRKKLKWNCGEMITLFRENGIFPPCSGCPMKVKGGT